MRGVVFLVWLKCDDMEPLFISLRLSLSRVYLVYLLPCLCSVVASPKAGVNADCSKIVFSVFFSIQSLVGRDLMGRLTPCCGPDLLSRVWPVGGFPRLDRHFDTAFCFSS